jgi:hypothetical protein
MRSIVEAGITSAGPYGPAVDMPRRAPAASATGPLPHGWRDGDQVQSSGRCALRRGYARPARASARCRDAAAVHPGHPAARVSTSAPSAGSAGPRRSDSIGDSSCRATILVPGSRPAIRARIAAPSDCTISAALAPGNTCSEATTKLSRHRVPLNGCDWGTQRHRQLVAPAWVGTPGG